MVWAYPNRLRISLKNKNPSRVCFSNKNPNGFGLRMTILVYKNIILLYECSSIHNNSLVNTFIITKEVGKYWNSIGSARGNMILGEPG